MKRIFTCLSLVFFLFAAVSCRKESQHVNRQQIEPAQTIKANVAAGQSYVLNMEAGSTAVIKQQASHYQSSQVATASNGNAVYTYAPLKGYTGIDEVTLQQTVTSTAHGGGYSSNTGEYTTTSVKTVVVQFAVGN